MRLSIIFPCSLLIILSLLVPHQCITPSEEKPADIINKTCNTCASKASSNFSYEFCYTSLDAIPVSHATNLGGLGLIALELALVNATNTISIISNILNKNDSSPHCNNCLVSCLELYLDISLRLEECIDEFVSGKKHDILYLWVSEIMQATTICELGFKDDGKVSPLTNENHNLSQLCGIVLCIIDLISPHLNSWF